MASVFIDLPASTVSIPTGASTELKQDSQITAAGATNTKLDSLIAKDFATQTTLAALLAELMLKADLLDTQPVSISGTVPVSGPLTDTQLRASAVPVSAGPNLNTSALNLEATQLLIKAKTDNIPAQGQALSSASLPVVLTALQEAALTPPAAITGFALETTQVANGVRIGAVLETAPATDTASSGLNGRLQRIAQNISAMILQLPATLGIKTSANSLSITPASDAVFTINTEAQTGSFAEDLTVSTTPETFTAPAGAFACFVQADDTNATNIRVKMGATAGIASGIQFQSGRSEMYEAGTDISYCTESGTGKLSVQWFVRS